MKKLGFGMMRLPLKDEGDSKSIDQELVNKMADYFIEKGFTYFDTAYPYHQGMSEVAARKALVERHPRDSFMLADKMPTWMITKKEDYRRIFNEQLEKCGVEYFDYYLLHTLGVSLYANSVKYGGFEFMKELKKEGKAKKIGFSFHDKADVLDKILTEHPEMEFVQLQINYIDWDSESIESRKCYEVALKHNKPVIVMEPVKGGSLANIPEEAEKLYKAYHPDLSVASWAVRYAASLENVFMVLSGMSDIEQVVDNTSYMRDMEPLNDEEKQLVNKAAGIINAITVIPCTECRYCVDGCPKKIPIPNYFSLYNNQKRFRLVPSHIASYNTMAKNGGKASDCISCKQCEKHCPQHISITEQLKEVSKIFEV
ncbi:MAG TPA: aldo/keto reductase [Clostridia bacterium]|nr:aldo/keto reductase [Clostridia bacterium]